MRYEVRFHSNTYGPLEPMDFYGQSMPLIPRVGEFIWSGLWEGTGKHIVKEVIYGYSDDLITINIEAEQYG